MSGSRSADQDRFLFKVANKDLKVVEFSAREEISAPFEVDLTLAIEEEIKFEDVIQQEALLTILGFESERYFHGIINKFWLAGSIGRFLLYKATLVPTMWLLSLERDCRIFQDLDVKEIVSEILSDAGIKADRFDFRLKETYPKREYCVQYRESDLHFISRLLEEEGIFYYFEHHEKDHLLVFGDGMVNYKPIEGDQNDDQQVEIGFQPPSGQAPEKEIVQQITLSRQITPGKYTHKDYNFLKPSLKPTGQDEAKVFEKIELYDYPGDFLDNDRGTALAKIRLEEARKSMDTAEGQSTCPRMIPGFTFKLTRHDLSTLEREYLLTGVSHFGSQPQVTEELSGGDGFSYSNHFIGIPSNVIFRPQVKTPKPSVRGIQSAIVTGPPGEEIYTDEHGRIKVLFHWDRLGKANEKSSCWIRVSQLWAGAGWGAMHIPRIGQEVIVDFLEGDPDQPVITGRLYHGTHKPPYELPDDKTKSTLKSNSSPDGKGFNEIRLEDKKDKEELYIHAQKDMNIAIENDRSEIVGNDRHLTVRRDKLEKVERDSHMIVKRDELKEIARDHNLKLSGKESVQITGSRSLSVEGDVIAVFKKNHSEEVSKDYYIKGKNLVLEAMTKLTIKVGGNFISIDSAGIDIKGTLVNINSGGSALSGSAGNLVAPAAPLEAIIAGTAVTGKATAAPKSSAAAAAHNAPTHVANDEKKAWIEIELVDEEDQPVTGEKYIITLPDGKTVATGTTDSEGLARVSGIDQGSCKINFPELHKDVWEKI